MIELSPSKKNKVNLADYNYQQDIENRMLMSDFSTHDVKVLEEILYSPLKVSLKKLARNLECDEVQLFSSLSLLAKSGLLRIQDENVIVDKDLRKYFEFQITRFDPQFKPDMEFMQGILRKVPIHILPSWYAIPRSSNNIFESIVEKNLLTPQIYLRYLAELNFGNPLINSIVVDLFSSSTHTVTSSDLIAKYNLKRRDFEEILLTLEFNFVGCLCYKQEGDHWLEFVAPLHEWHEYLTFIKNSDTPTIDPEETILQRSESVFSFIEEMTDLLTKAKETPLRVDNSPLTLKLCFIHLATIVDDQLHISEAGKKWIDLSLEDRALSLYRNPHNRILSIEAGDRYIREAEKSIKRILDKGWVYWDDFCKGILVPMSEHSIISLKRFGKQWKYTLPIYSPDETAIFKATVFEWLYESGMVITGTCRGRDCFAVTHFGRFFFGE